MKRQKTQQAPAAENSHRGPFSFRLRDVDKTKIGVVGGKAANLGELSGINGIQVPDGFCISTEAFKKIVGENPDINRMLDELSVLTVENRHEISELAREIRTVIEGVAIPPEIDEEITGLLSTIGETAAYAVRSSATAEDLPGASFAGQQDSYLNIVGKASILKHVSRCWASLFTERAVFYRLQNGFDHRKVYLSVLVQKMVFPEAAGILFTADPVTSNRKLVSIDSSFGLGEALVSGLVNPDIYKVRNREIIQKTISTKQLAVYPLKNGGTKKEELQPGRQTSQTLTDQQILRLAAIGKKIENHFGHPQDIEWCLADDAYYIVQSRPITTLYPVPEAPDHENHVYVSVGHNQMMTDAMKPLGLSFFLLTTSAPMYTAGGRLFVDVTQQLAAADTRNKLLEMFGKSDVLMTEALKTIVDRGNFIPSSPDDGGGKTADRPNKVTTYSGFRTQIESDPAIVSRLIERNERSIEELRNHIKTKSGTDLFDFILEDIQHSKKTLWDPQHLKAILAAMDASSWVNEKMEQWLGEKNVADTLSQSVPNNITSEMGLALLDVADVIRPYPAVIEYLRQVKNENFLDELLKYRGGQETQQALRTFLKKYGMRCPGEIDITRTRWSERPGMLLPVILSNVKNFEPGASKRKFEQGQQEALKKEQEILDRLRQLPDGEEKARETKQMIDLIRNFAGYREYPKYGIVSRYLIYKEALLAEARELVKGGVIDEQDDVYYLTFEEFREAVRTRKMEYDLIGNRKEAYKTYQKLSPPRVITSDGEIVTGMYKIEKLPANAIAGLAVSAGLTEGRARVILNMEEADLEDGDILVTRFTDPSWTPLFLSIKGLVTEVGGLMTHGAVIAREYGLPAVVAVENATKLIKNGQRIRVHGTEGYVEIL